MATMKMARRGSSAVQAFNNAKRAEKAMSGKKPSAKKCDMALDYIEAAYMALNKIDKRSGTGKLGHKIVGRAQAKYEKVCE